MDDDTPLREAGGAGAVFPFLPHVRWLRPACDDPLVHRSPSSLLSTLPHSDHTPAPASGYMASQVGVSGIEFQNKAGHGDSDATRATNVHFQIKLKDTFSN